MIQMQATAMIGEVVHGEGHFLGHPETLKRMQTDFLYPKLADRRRPQDWEEDGPKDIRTRAKARQILGFHFPHHISKETDKHLRAIFDIRLPENAMEA